MVANDAIVVVRDVMLRGYHVVITAERIERTGLWLVIGRVDGELHDAVADDYPEKVADRMLEQIDAEYE